MAEGARERRSKLAMHERARDKGRDRKSALPLATVKLPDLEQKVRGGATCDVKAVTNGLSIFPGFKALWRETPDTYSYKKHSLPLSMDSE